ncbi:MAG: primosomal protein N' [Elusimicrobia bacterium]|nr:primosomal protein N' [Elusimicrobiota bacterium]
MRIAEVAVPVPLDKAFDYEVPAAMTEAVVPGARVRAPFGPRQLVGFVLSVRDGVPERPLKPLSKALDPQPILGAEQLALARWLAERYCAPIGDCVKTLVTANLRTALKPVLLSVSEPARPPTPPPPAAFQLTASQAGALGSLEAMLALKRFHAALIHGVPASGKTEVYLRLIRRAVEHGGQALFLVPEIALTKPFFAEFSEQLGLPVALWHSQVGAKVRRETWLGLRSGRVRVVVGARSASLLPFNDLRLAVVDEEQDESYKEDDTAPYYHARDVVLERGRAFGALVILGSATPSLESFSRADASGKAPDISLIRMDERVARETPPPRVRVLAQTPYGGFCITNDLLEAVKERLRVKEQSILLVNRRGYSNFVMCKACSWVARCPKCSIAFVHHKGAPEPEADLFGGAQGYSLLCHHCGKTEPVPPSCGRCGKGPLRFAGVGTQKVVEELRERLPGVRVLRMDGDSVAKEKAAEAGVWGRFRDGHGDILVGTKLVAKGYHFPRVTLVGVVDADTMLGMPDFRSAERTVQLLVQAAGRAGRADKAGEVILQTAQPEHYAIQAVARGDYPAYARREMEFRSELRYPPASTLVRILFLGRTQKATVAAAEAAAAALRAVMTEPDEALGPAPGVHSKFEDRFRFHLILKVCDPARLRPLLAAAKAAPIPSGVQVKINVDPYDMF